MQITTNISGSELLLPPLETKKTTVFSIARKINGCAFSQLKKLPRFYQNIKKWPGNVRAYLTDFLLEIAERIDQFAFKLFCRIKGISPNKELPLNFKPNFLITKDELKTESPPVLPKWFVPPENLPVVDDKLLIHLLGDQFAKNSKLEGHQSKVVLDYVGQCLKQNPSISTKVSIQKVHSLIESALNIENNVFDTPLKRDMATLLKKEIEKAINAEQSLLIRGGWIDKTAGHSMYYEIAPQKDGKYTFRIYNRGSGIDFHDLPEQPHVKLLYPACKEIIDIEKDRILNMRFIQAIVEMRVYAEQFTQGSYSIEDTHFSAEDIYTSLVPLLQGKPSPLMLEFEDLMGQQRSGTCSWKSLTAVLRKHLSYKEYKILKYQLKLQTLWSYYIRNKDRLLIDDEIPRQLVRRTTENFQDEIEKLHQASFLDDEEYIQAINLLSTIQNRVQYAERMKERDFEKQCLINENGPIFGTFNYNDDVKYYVKQKTTTKELTKIDQPTTDPIPSDELLKAWKNWMPDPTLFLQDLRKFNRLNEESFQKEQYRSIHEGITQLLKKIPLASKDPTFWTTLLGHEEKKIDEIMVELSNLVDYFYHSSFFIEGIEKYFPSRIHTLAKAQYIQENLKTKSSLKREGLNEPGEFYYLNKIFSGLHDFVYNGDPNQFYFFCKDMQITQEIHEIYTYLKNMVGDCGMLENLLRDRCVLGMFDKEINHSLLSNNSIKDQKLDPALRYLQIKLKASTELNQFLAKKYDELKDHPEAKYEDTTEEEKIALAYCYGDKEHLSETFLLWRRQLLQTQTLTRGIFTRPLAQSVKKEDFFHQLSYKKSENPYNTSNTFQIDCVVPALKQKQKDYLQEHHNDVFLYNAFKNNFPPIQNEDLKKVVELWNKELAQSQIYGEAYSDCKLPSSFKKELIALATAKSLQIVQTMNFFSRHHFLLNNPDYQTIFQLLIFEKNLLIEELKINETLLPSLKKFILEGYQNAQETGNIQTSIYFLHLSRHLQPYIDFIKLGEDFILPYKDLLQQCLDTPRLTPDEKSIIYQELLASYSKNQIIDQKDCMQMLKAIFHLRKYPLKKEQIDHVTLNEQQEAIEHLHDQIEDYVRENSSLIINTVIQDILPEAKDNAWKITQFPHVGSTDNKYTIDLLKGDIYEKNKSMNPIPETMKIHEHYVRLFGNNDYAATRLNFHTYEFQDKKKHTYRLFNSPPELIIHRKHQNEWLQFIPWEEQETEFLSNKDLRYAYSYWKGIDSEKIFLLPHSQKPLPDLGECEVVVKDEKAHINRKSKNSKSLTLWASYFDGGSWWYDQDRNPKLVEFPRLHLSFRKTSSSQDCWLCDQFPGYHLKSNQYLPGMNKRKNPYVLLENVHGELKVIIKNEKISKKRQKDESFLSRNLWVKGTFAPNEQRYFIYDLRVNETNETFYLQPTTPEAALYLAYRDLAALNYSEASYHLSDVRISHGNYKELLPYLWQIIHLPNGDCSIEASAIRLRAAYHCLKMSQKMSQNEKQQWLNQPFIKKLHEDCENYVDQIQKTKTFRLSPDEEKELIHFVLGNDEVGPSLQLIKYLELIDPKFRREKLSKTSMTKEKPSLRVETLSDKLINILKKACYSSETFGVGFLYTRPEAKIMANLLICYLKDSEKQKNPEYIQEISDCIHLATNSGNNETLTIRAILFMLITFPDRYALPKLVDGKTDWAFLTPILSDHNNLANDQPVRRKVVHQARRHGAMRRSTLPSKKSPFANAIPPSMHFRKEMGKNLRYKKIKYERFFQKSNININFQKTNLWQTLHKKIKALFSSAALSEKCVKNEFHRLEADCDLFLRDNSTPKVSYQLKKNALPEIHENLQKEIAGSHFLLVKQEKEILALANPLLKKASNVLEADIQGQYLGGKKQLLTLDDLIFLYAQGDLETLLTPPSHLNKQKILQVRNSIEAYLNQATYQQKLERSFKIASELLACHKELTASERQERESELIQELTNRRQYDLQKHSAFLALEYYSHLLFNKEQVEKIGKLLECGDILPVYQMIMGSGKTTILMPLLALLMADKKNLSILMVPDSLYESVYSEISATLRGAFHQKVHTFDYSRDSDYSAKRLMREKDRLEEIIKGQGCLLTTPKSVHCFYLHFIELWKSLPKSEGEEREKLFEQFILMRDILNLFKNKGSVLIDEIDTILHCRTEVNYPIGDLKHLPEAEVKLMLQIYDILLSSSFRQKIKLEFDLGQLSIAHPFTKESYQKEIKPLLIQELLKAWKCSGKEYELIQKYLDHDTTHLNELKEAYRFVDSYPNSEMRNTFALAKEQINILLPVTLEKNCDEHYGSSSDFSVMQAIPYHNSKPVEGSRFANQHEIANYTCQTYLKHGINKNIVRQKMEALQLEAWRELKEGKNLKETEAYLEFATICGKQFTPHLLKLSEQDLELITANINQDRSLFSHYLSKYILPSITFYTRKINSNAQSLIPLFHHVRGFSGTTWNDKTYHTSLSSFAAEGVDAKTLFILLEQSQKNGDSILEVPSNAPFEFLQTIPLRENDLALIDNGAYLKGPDPLELAKRLLKRLQEEKSPIKGIVFHDNQDRKMILEVGKLDPIPLSNSRLKESERFTIFTKPFTTGANIRQERKASALVTIGRSLILRDLLQSVWRMRGIDREQRIQFVIANDVKKILKETLQKSQNEPVTLEEIILFATINQARQAGDDNYLSTKQKMLEVVQNEIRTLLLDPTFSEQDTVSLFTEAMEDIFSPEIRTEPYDLYGALEYKKASEQVLQQDQSYHYNLMKNVIDTNPLLGKYIRLNECEKKIAAVKNLAIVPNELIQKKQDNKNQFVQVQQLKQMQNEQITNEILQQNKVWKYISWITENKSDVDIISKKLKSRSDSASSNNSLKQVLDNKLATLRKAANPCTPHKLSKLFTSHPDLKEIAGAFSSEIKFGYNFAPLVPKSGNEYTMTHFFENPHKPIDYILLGKDQKTKQWTTILLDQNDAATFRWITKKYYPKGISSDVKVSLYKLNSGQVVSGSPVFTDAELQDEGLQKLLVQLKFLSGTASYTPSQKKILKKWVNENNPEALKKVYETFVIQNHPEKEAALHSMQDVWVA